MTRTSTAPAADIYQSVTDRIIAALETGTAPWLKPWTTGTTGGLEPYNAASGRAYNGINLLVLGCSAHGSQGWLTFKQAAELGGSVRKGERGTQIVFWAFPKRLENGVEKVVPFARAYTVFNVDQCDGLEGKLKLPAPVVAGDTSVNAIAARLGAVVKHGGGRACYSIASDTVTVPSLDAFKTVDHYQSTLAHELVHWTGHKSRCARDFANRFGSEAYAFEELVAEIGSAFVCARQGVALEGLQHSEYVASWLKVLKGDKRAVFTAASKAKAAAAFMLDQADAEELEEAA